jgi:hypothetical protein
MLHVIPADVERRASFLPAIYHAADRAATTRRRRHMRLAATNLDLALSLSVLRPNAPAMRSDWIRRTSSDPTATAATNGAWMERRSVA